MSKKKKLARNSSSFGIQISLDTNLGQKKICPKFSLINSHRFIQIRNIYNPPTFLTFSFIWAPPRHRPRRKLQRSVGAGHPVNAIPENSIVQGGLIFRHFLNLGNFISAWSLNSGKLFPLLLPEFLAIPTWLLHILCKLNSLFLSLPFLFIYTPRQEHIRIHNSQEKEKKKKKKTEAGESMYRWISMSVEFAWGPGNSDSRKILETVNSFAWKKRERVCQKLPWPLLRPPPVSRE